MKFIQLPVSGRLVNIYQIFILEHEVIEGITTAIAHFINGEKLLTKYQDAEYLISVLGGRVYV